MITTHGDWRPSDIEIPIELRFPRMKVLRDEEFVRKMLHANEREA
jgi:hypothetical protein